MPIIKSAKKAARQAEKRICVIHKNIPNVLTQITSALKGTNIENLLNKSRKEYAYSILDVAECDDQAIIETLSKIEGVIRVRIV